MREYAISSFLRNQKLIILVNVLLGFLLIIAALIFVRDILTVSFQPMKKEIAGEPGSSGMRKHDLMDYGAILGNNPFGFPAGELKPLSSRPSTVSPSEVSLVGTVAGEKSVSYAIFMDNTGRQDIFRIGDSVFGLGTLEQVREDKVFVGGGEDLREIPLSEVSVSRQIPSVPLRRSHTSRFSRKMSEGTYAIDQKKIQQAIADPKELMTDARLLPNYVNGQQHGFVMSEVKRGGIYNSLGLRNGDVLLRINNFDISNPENALQAFNALRGLERVQLDILRNGSKMTMTYQIR